jgi:sec-independent protein translocase protein TatC
MAISLFHECPSSAYPARFSKKAGPASFRLQSGEGGQNMSASFFSHLAELRRRLILCLLCATVLTVVAWNFHSFLLTVVLAPVTRLTPTSTMIFTGLPDAFAVAFKVSLWAGLMASAPFCLLQLWAFVAPGLLPSERSKAPLLTLLAVVLFVSGALFAYFVAFPLTFRFFLAFSSEELTPLLAVDRYLSLALSLVAAFALSFQMPLVLTFLAHVGIVSPKFLRKNRSYAVVCIFIAAAVLTPPDVISQIVLACPLLLLYALSGLMVGATTRRAEATEQAADSEKFS